MKRPDPYADNTAEKMVCGLIAHLLLKHGYTASSVANAVHVPESFVKYMEQDGIKYGLFPGPSKVCHKFLESRVRLDRTDFLACHRRILAPETPPKMFCQMWGMSIKELVLAEMYITDYASDDKDPMRFLVDAKPKKNKSAVEVFVESHCQLGSSFQCDTKVLFEAWNAWRSKRKLKEINTQSLGKKLKKLCSAIDTVSYRAGKSLSRKYIGIGIKNERN